MFNSSNENIREIFFFTSYSDICNLKSILYNEDYFITEC